MKIDFDANEIRPIVQVVAEEVIQQLEQDRAKLGGRIAFNEAEAAAKLGINRHQLRDWRLQGKVRAHRPGKTFLYLVDELLEDISRL